MTINPIYRVAVTGGVAVAAALAMAHPAGAADFYAGKTIQLYIGFGPGGGYDRYGRVLARNMGRHIPGHPHIIAQNMPGAGGLKATKYMYTAAKRDGTVIGEAPAGLAIEQLTRGKSLGVDAAKFNWLGRLTGSETLFFTWHTSKTKSFKDLTKRVTPFGSSGAGNTYYVPMALNRLAGAKFKLITGYHGSTSVLLAVERGEVDGGYGLWSDLRVRKAEWLRDKKINPIIAISSGPLDGLPNVPTIEDIVNTKEGRKIMEILTLGEFGRSFYTTEGVPAARVAELRNAFDAMLKDDTFKADVKKSHLSLDPMTGKQLHANILKVVHAPAKTVAELRKVIR